MSRIEQGLAELRRNAPVCGAHLVLACVVCMADEYALALVEAKQRRTAWKREPLNERFDIGGES